MINVGNSCCLIFFFWGPVIFLINKKLKRTVFIQNRDFELQYTLFKRLESKKNFFLKETLKKFKES